MSGQNHAVRNSLLIREVNERIHEVSFPWLDGDTHELLCECRDANCIATIAVEHADYRTARERPGRFLIASFHADDEDTRVLARWDGYVTVEFDDGER